MESAAGIDGKFNCILCGSNSFSELMDKWPFTLTSDLVPTHKTAVIYQCRRCHHLQKRIHAGYLNYCEDIYANYKSYASGGKDAYLPYAGEATTMDRSSRIIRKLEENCSLPKKGLLLDIGGGHGHFAALFREAYPLWRATVADKSDHQIEEQPVAVQYANDLHDLKPDSFDLITLIHTLKHLPVPVSTLRKAHELLRPGGYCLVQTPNTAASLWDCIIYDHISHFTRASLVTAMEKSYFRSIVVSNNVSERELTFIGQKGLPTSNEKNQGFLELSPIPSENSDSVTREVNQYLKLLLRLQSAVSLSLKSDLMLAGAGIGSSWFLAYTSIEILALVDEDANKCGRTWMDKKIVSPRQVPVDHIVIIPFTQDESARIRQRWRDEYGVNCVWIGDLLA